MPDGLFWFGLEVSGVLQGAFSGLTISSEVEPLEATDAGPPQARRLRPTVTIERRHTDDLSLFAWHQAVVAGPIAAARKDCTVIVFDASGRSVARYELERAWPFRVVIGALTEAATLTCDNVRRVAV